jgi:hypothetical protein
MGAGEFTPKFVRWWLRRQFGPCDPRSVLVGGDGADLPTGMAIRPLRFGFHAAASPSGES